MQANRLLELSRTHAKLVALLVAGALATPMLYGCGASTDTADADQADEATTASSAVSADASSDGDADTDSSDSTAQAQSAPEFDFSAGIDDDGHWSDVTALDYVTLPSDYSAIPVTAADIDPSDDDIQSKIDSITSSYATTEQVTDREVKDGDTLNIDYVGSVDGVEFDGGSTKGNGTTVTIGTTNYIDGFLDQLVGHKPGETFDINVTFPENYGVDDLNGKDAVFSVTINYIQETVQPEVTDEWVEENLKDNYGWTSVEEMRQGVAESLRHTNLANYVQDYVLNNSQVSEVPSSIVDYQGGQLVYQYEYYANMYNMDLASFLKMSAGVDNTDDLVTNNASNLNDAAKAYLVFQAVAEDAGITVSDDELATYLKSVTGSDDVESLENQYGRGYLMLQALVQKVGEYLMTNAQVEGDEAAETNASATASTTTDGSASSSESKDSDTSTAKNTAVDKTGSGSDASQSKDDADDTGSASTDADKATATGTSDATASAGKSSNAASDKSDSGATSTSSASK